MKQLPDELPRPSGAARMRPLLRRPKQKVFLPDLPRQWKQIDQGLRALLWKLACGNAAWPCYLHGPTGRGKSCAALALADITAGAYYTTAKKIADKMLERDNCFPGLMGDMNLVIVDEIGRPGVQAWLKIEAEALKQVADTREHKPTIWIGNLPPGRLAGHYSDPALASRIVCGSSFGVAGVDRRQVRTR